MLTEAATYELFPHSLFGDNQAQEQYYEEDNRSPIGKMNQL